MSLSQSKDQERDSSKQITNLIEIESASRYPKLSVDWLRDHEVQRSLPNLLRNFHQRHEECRRDRRHDEYSCGKDKRVGARPTGHRVRVAVNYQKDQYEKRDPNDTLKDFGEEVGSEFQLTGK